MRARKVLIFLGIFFLLTGGLAKTKEAQLLNPLTVPFGVTTQSLQVKDVILQIPGNQIIGKAESGPACMKTGYVRADSSEYYVTQRPYKEILSQQLKSYNYNLVEISNALFESESKNQADFIIGGLIIGMEGNVCFPSNFLKTTQKTKGSAFLEIVWQVFSVEEKRVVFKTITQGSATVKKKVSGGLGVALEEAFRMAAKNLLADKNFYTLLVASTPKLDE